MNEREAGAGGRSRCGIGSGIDKVQAGWSRARDENGAEQTSGRVGGGEEPQEMGGTRA